MVKQEVFEKNVTALAAYKDTAEKMMCAFFPDTIGPHMTYTPGGLLLAYADYLSESFQQLNCGKLKFQPDSLRRIVKRQVYYVGYYVKS